MFEYHGWATLQSSNLDEDGLADPELPPIVVARVRRLVTDRQASDQAVDVRFANGQLHFWIAGYHNHREGAIISTFEEIGRVAPDSYGILYIRDDEDLQHENEWIVLVMTHGVVSVRPDSYLSPCVPVIEDPE